MFRMRFSLSSVGGFLLLLLVLVFSAALASSVSDSAVDSMSVRELKAFLKERGLECRDCVEKSHLAQFVKKHRDDPVVENAAPKNPGEQPRRPRAKSAAGRMMEQVVDKICPEAAQHILGPLETVFEGLKSSIMPIFGVSETQLMKQMKKSKFYTEAVSSMRVHFSDLAD